MRMQRWTLAAFVLLAGSLDVTAASRATEPGARFQRPRLAAGFDHACAVRDSGSVGCWGSNFWGQTGAGNVATPVLLPTFPLDAVRTAAVAAGARHTCALMVEGTGSVVRCWGDNTHGQLGDGTNLARSTPGALASGLTNPVAIASGFFHTCAVLANGTVRCWGENTFGQLGDGTSTSRNVPVPVSGLANAIGIAAGNDHTCALIADGTASCWGQNFLGQLGEGAPSGTSRLVPVPVSGLSGAVAITSFDRHTCALMAHGGAMCWGSNASGQLGDNTTQTRGAPVAVQNLVNGVAIATSADNTCALRSDGTATCWGANGLGQLGDGSTSPRLRPATTVLGVANAVEIAAGAGFACVMEASGTVRCWGRNDAGQLGNGTTQNSGVATVVGAAFVGVAARGVTAGGTFSCARRGTGRSACWGADAEGENGNGATVTRTVAEVAGLQNTVMLATGHNEACAQLANGELRCWGDNVGGQLGSGTQTDQSSPVAVQAMSDAVGVSMGGNHACALRVGGMVACWGSNGSGQLGSGTTTGTTFPNGIIVNLTNAVAVAAGTDHSCALIADGTVRCWGANGSGQLGLGVTDTMRTSPVLVANGGALAVAIAAGDRFTCALMAGGTVRCWGSNAFGQLGNNTLADTDVPNTVIGLTDAVSISAGAFHACALHGSGRASCWGRNEGGELGSADTLNHSTPTQVVKSFTTIQGAKVPLFLTTAIAISAGRRSEPNSPPGHTCALLATGTPQCWGRNEHNQVGDNSGISPRFRPVTVPSFSANVAPAGDLDVRGRIATLTLLLNCDVGSHAVVGIRLTQGGVSGSRSAAHVCTGTQAEVDVTVPATGPDGFVEGASTAELEATIRENGTVTDHLLWTRNVQLTVQ